jgi:hypothetical protein
MHRRRNVGKALPGAPLVACDRQHRSFDLIRAPELQARASSRRAKASHVEQAACTDVSHNTPCSGRHGETHCSAPTACRSHGKRCVKLGMVGRVTQLVCAGSAGGRRCGITGGGGATEGVYVRSGASARRGPGYPGPTGHRRGQNPTGHTRESPGTSAAYSLSGRWQVHSGLARRPSRLTFAATQRTFSTPGAVSCSARCISSAGGGGTCPL